MEHEVNGLDYRYVNSDKARLSVVVQGIENGSASLLDAKARFYDADNRRFAAFDPILDPSGYDLRQYVMEPMSLGQYLYVRNNAVMFIDPNGCAPYSAKRYDGRFELYVSPQWLDILQTAAGSLAGFTQLNYLGQRFINGLEKIDVASVSMGALHTLCITKGQKLWGGETTFVVS